MDLENSSKELSMEDLEGVSGGVLTDAKREHIRRVIRSEKRKGTTLDELLAVIEDGSEEMAYVKDVWQQVSV